MENLTTGQLAERAGVNVQTVRFYERRGLLPEPPRSPAGYRLYRRRDLQRLRFIRRAQTLGFRLAEIEELLDLRVREDGSCGAVQARAEAAIARIDEQVEQLARMHGALTSLLRACRQRKATGECPILESLETEGVGRTDETKRARR